MELNPGKWASVRFDNGCLGNIFLKYFSLAVTCCVRPSADRSRLLLLLIRNINQVSLVLTDANKAQFPLKV